MTSPTPYAAERIQAEMDPHPTQVLQTGFHRFSYRFSELAYRGFIIRIEWSSVRALGLLLFGTF